MIKSELINAIASKQSHLTTKEVEQAVNTILEHMSDTLATGGRIEIRGFGSFEVRYRKARTAHNPKTGNPVSVHEKYIPHFKPGKDLKERVNSSKKQESVLKSFA